MTERHIDTLEFFVSPGYQGQGQQGQGTQDQPYASIEQALQAIGEREDVTQAASNPALHGKLEIVCLSAPGTGFVPGAKPSQQFNIDMQAAASGDGSEFAPWQDLPSAIGGLLASLGVGRLRMNPGDRWQISFREPFTATALESRKQLKETIAKYLFLTMAMLLVLPVCLILGYLTFKAWPILSVEFLFSNPENQMKDGGIWAPMIGTFFLVLISLLISAPIGVMAGVYLNEYAGDNWVTRIINLAVVNLAGVPSIVHALFGVGAFVYFAQFGRSLLAASCTVAVMTLPVIITSSKEALASVPMSFREACWNLGALRWQTIRTIVLPNSISGILTGVILQVSRAAEKRHRFCSQGLCCTSMSRNTGLAAWVPFGLSDGFMALSNHLFVVAKQLQGVPEELQYGTAVVLIGLVLVVNSLSISVRIYLRTRKKW